ncbi:MAG: hypothetical protein WCG03_08895, partial [Kiritimatiellales bacterium]
VKQEIPWPFLFAELLGHYLFSPGPSAPATGDQNPYSAVRAIPLPVGADGGRGLPTGLVLNPVEGRGFFISQTTINHQPTTAKTSSRWKFVRSTLECGDKGSPYRRFSSYRKSLFTVGADGGRACTEDQQSLYNNGYLFRIENCAQRRGVRR